MILSCIQGSALAGSSYPPPSGIYSIGYQCHKEALSPKVHPKLYACVDVILTPDIIRRRKDEGRKHKEACS